MPEANYPDPRITPGGSDRPDWPLIESHVRQLATNYTMGTDAIGRGELENGIAIFQKTFTGEAIIEVSGAPTTRRIGPVEWSGFVNDTFRGRNDVRTQHLVGSINVVLSSDTTAEMSSYMHAAHLRGTGEVQTVLLTYVDHCVKTAEGWRIAHRTLFPMSSWMEPKAP
ncbi:MAG: nuclear transport factor 2 family protein [Dehalococcoidia bacterium]